MEKGKTVFAFAALATCVFSVHAVDWSAYKSGTYVVPADTTNEVTQAEISAFNNIAKVVFENANSAISLATSNFPTSVYFQGPGSVIMQEKAIFTGSRDSAIRRTLGAGDENGFVKFVFKKGMGSHDGTTANLYYFHDKDKGGYVATNATLYLDGTITNVSFCGGAKRSLNGRIDLGENINFTLGQSIGGNEATTSNFFGVVRQRGGQMLCNGSYLGFRGSATAAYFLENGSLAAQNENNRWYVYPRYLHFRQNGGRFNTPCWQRPWSENDEYTLPFDFIFGGSAVATNMFENSTPKFIGPMNIVVMGDAKVNAGWLRSYINDKNEGGQYVHNVCVNGGELLMNTRPGSVNVYYSFNGGTLGAKNQAPAVFGNNAQFDNPVWVRIYENGGCIHNDNESNSNNQYLYLPHLKEPVGNVVWSVELSNELRSKVWQSPPSVVIADSTGAGSNAVAIVDYDFDSGKVTNITVACRGENYSGAAGAVTANLYYKAGDALLSTPLVCSVGPCVGGDVTFAGGNTIYAGGITNTYHGATIVDMDREGVYDHPASSGQEPAYHSFIIKPRQPLFSNCTNVVVKSGDFYYDSDSGGVQLTTYFPNCSRLELYGGHISKWAYSGKDLVVGGECWLCNHNFGYQASLTVPADGTLTVDAACLTDGVTPKLKYGTVNFTSGAKITVKNWDEVPVDGAYHTLLDLSETNVSGTPALEIPDGLSSKASLKWDSAARLLRMRCYRGFRMIMR